MNVIYISYDGLTDPLGKSQVLPYLYGLSNKGFSITVLSYEKRINYSKFKEEISIQLTSSNITWIPLKYHVGLSVISTLLNLLKGALVLNSFVKREKVQIVHCRSYISAFLGLFLKKFYGIKLVFDMRGFWPDERREVGMLGSNLLYSMMKYFEKKFLLNADSIISLTEAGINEMRSWPYMSDQEIDKCTQISTCSNIQNYKRSYDVNTSRIVRNAGYKFAYIGSIGPWHSLAELCNFMKFTYFQLPDSSFKLIVNQGQEHLHSFINKNQLDSTRFSIDNIPHDQIPEALENFDIGFFFIPPQYAKIASSPTKMGEMLSAGLPIITGHSIGDVDNIIESNNIGYILKSFNDDSYVEALNKVTALLESDRIGITKRCLSVAEKYYSLDKAVEKYAGIYSQLLR